jgi:invasion protein IalB
MFDECTTKLIYNNPALQLMKTNNKIIIGVLAAAIASLMLSVNGGFTKALAQTPMIPSAGQSTSNATSSSSSSMPV